LYLNSSAPSEEIYGEKAHNVEKYIQWVASYNCVAMFIRLAVFAAKICEIPRNSPKI